MHQGRLSGTGVPVDGPPPAGDADPVAFRGWLVPRQRRPAPTAPAPTAPVPTASAPTASGGEERPAVEERPEDGGCPPGEEHATAVLPRAGSALSHSTRMLRAWMLSLPADLLALLAPLLWTTQYWKGTAFTAVLTVAIFAAGGLYRGRRHMSILDEFPSLVARLLVSAAIVAIIAAERHDSVGYVAGFMRAVAVSAGLVLVARAVSRTVVVTARRRRWVEHGAIIVGGGPVGIELARLLRRYPQYGLRFVGFVDEPRARPAGGTYLPVVGGLGEIDTIIQATGCDVIIIADAECAEADLLAAVEGPCGAGCDLWIVPRLRELQSYGAGIPDHIGAIPVIHVRRPALSGPAWAAKRLFDIVLSVVALVGLSPVMAVCAAAVRIEGGPGVLFRQQRIGRYGRPFEVIKFRSMRPADEHEAGTTWSVANDPRVGPVGRWLRRTSLDELPQFWNVLRGDMTVVGPRPERPFFVDQFSANDPRYAMRHRVPAGLTGLAQVSGLRGDTPISDRARFDNYYIENWSLWLDIKVLLRTVAEVLRGGGS